jgi:hypothetical protein
LQYLREELARIDESWAAARFDSLPHVVHILTSKDREADIHILKEQSDVVEEVVDEVVHAYHGGFNKAIQNYSQILRLFSESTEKIGDLKHDLAEAKQSLGARNKQLHQLWYRSVTLRHIISLLDQIEGIAKVGWISCNISLFILSLQCLLCICAAIKFHTSFIISVSLMLLLLICSRYMYLLFFHFGLLKRNCFSDVKMVTLPLETLNRFHLVLRSSLLISSFTLLFKCISSRL